MLYSLLLVRERPEAMTRGLVLGCLLLFLVGWLAPVPVQAMSSTRAAALWRTEAFAHTAVAQAEAGKLEAAKAGIETPLAAARQEPDPYGHALALVEIAHAQAILGAEDAALATLAEASALAPEIGPEG